MSTPNLGLLFSLWRSCATPEYKLALLLNTHYLLQHKHSLVTFLESERSKINKSGIPQGKGPLNHTMWPVCMHTPISLHNPALLCLWDHHMRWNGSGSLIFTSVPSMLIKHITLPSQLSKCLEKSITATSSSGIAMQNLFTHCRKILQLLHPTIEQCTD